MTAKKTSPKMKGLLNLLAVKTMKIKNLVSMKIIRAHKFLVNDNMILYD